MLEVFISESWAHPWEGFKSSLLNCSQGEIDWVHPAYAQEEAEPGWPRAGSILWQVNHVGACKSAYAWAIAHPDRTDNAAPWQVILAKEPLLVALELAHDSFLDACMKADPARKIMDKGGHTYLEYVGIAIRHELWHAGQIAQLRRLYRHAVGADRPARTQDAG